MEAKDTVMTVAQIGGIMIPCVSPVAQGIILAQKQSEISFRVGRKQTIIGVEKWIQDYWTGLGSYNIPLKEWQAKLREWK